MQEPEWWTLEKLVNTLKPICALLLCLFACCKHDKQAVAKK